MLSVCSFIAFFGYLLFLYLPGPDRGACDKNRK